MLKNAFENMRILVLMNTRLPCEMRIGKPRPLHTVELEPRTAKPGEDS